jgi:hypothetical protein
MIRRNAVSREANALVTTKDGTWGDTSCSEIMWLALPFSLLAYTILSL